MLLLCNYIAITCRPRITATRRSELLMCVKRGGFADWHAPFSTVVFDIHWQLGQIHISNSFSVVSDRGIVVFSGYCRFLHSQNCGVRNFKSNQRPPPSITDNISRLARKVAALSICIGKCEGVVAKIAICFTLLWITQQKGYTVTVAY